MLLSKNKSKFWQGELPRIFTSNYDLNMQTYTAELRELKMKKGLCSNLILSQHPFKIHNRSPKIICLGTVR